MASRVSDLPVKVHSRLLSLMISDKNEELVSSPSCLVPGGETSPALAFRLYSKGAPIPENKFFPGAFEIVPDDKVAPPVTLSEFYMQAQAAKAQADQLAAQAARLKAEEEAAKAAEIERKLKLADEYIAQQAKQPEQPPAAT